MTATLHQSWPGFWGQRIANHLTRHFEGNQLIDYMCNLMFQLRNHFINCIAVYGNLAAMKFTEGDYFNL